MERGVCRAPLDREETWSTSIMGDRIRLSEELSSPFPLLVWALLVPALEELGACLIGIRKTKKS